MSTPDWDQGRIAEVLTRPLGAAASTSGWSALPPSGPVRLLVPRGTPAATAPAVRRLLGHGSLTRRLGAELGAQALRLGGSHLLRRRAGWDTAGDRLLAHAREVAGQPDAIGVIRLNAGRPNRKPVVQLLRPDLHHSVAYVKVGWDALTAPLVRAETATLRTLEPPAGLEVPAVLGSHDDGIVSLAVAPVRGDGDTHHTSARELAQHAVRLFAGDAAARGPAVALRDNDLVRDIADGSTGSHDDVAAGLARALDRFLALHGDVELPTARWHGDFSPANVLVQEDRVAAWDWERSTPTAPLGLDAAYTLLTSLPPQVATSGLADLDVAHGPALVALALLLSAHRHVLAAAAGIPTSVDQALARLDTDGQA